MLPDEIINLLGNPDEIRVNEEFEHKFYFIYNEKQIRLTFYKNENGKMGYIESSYLNIEFEGNKIINQEADKVKHEVFKNGINKWEKS